MVTMEPTLVQLSTESRSRAIFTRLGETSDSQLRLEVRLQHPRPLLLEKQSSGGPK